MTDKRCGLNEYERMRNERIAQNNTRLQEFGVLKLANSMTSLVDSNKNNKRKAKDKSDTKKKDTEYTPNYNSGSDDEFDPLNFDLLLKRKQLLGHDKVINKHTSTYITTRSYSTRSKECRLENSDEVVETGFDGETSCHSDDEDSDEFVEDGKYEDVDEHVHLDSQALEVEGTIARDYSYAPLIIDNWRKVPNKDKIWEYVLMKYVVPAESKDWVIKTVGTAWRVHKCRFKRKHYISYMDDKSRWQKRSKTVPEEDFIKLL
ncbi:hypothetical protein KSS87_019263 [Heliosperma pusillum]|nr:hypothetical protein KSS87_019263 [Heliosperma pusillum]